MERFERRTQAFESREIPGKRCCPVDGFFAKLRGPILNDLAELKTVLDDVGTPEKGLEIPPQEPALLHSTGIASCDVLIRPYTTGRLLDFGCGSKPYRTLFNTTDYVGNGFPNEEPVRYGYRF